MFIFYDIHHLIILGQLKLIQPFVDDGNKIVTSEFRLSYYSGTKQYQVRTMIEAGLVQLIDHPEDLTDFIDEFAELFSYAGAGVLGLMHLCKTSKSILVIEDNEQLIIDVAAYFGVNTITVEEFYKQKIKDTKYHDFLIGTLKK
jgi:hypothetical protein